jgi:hypothetical protein
MGEGRQLDQMMVIEVSLVTPFAALAGSLKKQYASQSASFAAVTIAVTALIGQWAGLPMLSSWGLPAMRPLGALLLATSASRS